LGIGEDAVGKSVDRKISRRIATLGGLALPWSIGAARATTPMREAELRALVRVYNDARKTTAVQADRTTIAIMLAERDAAASRIVAASGGRFEQWLATAKEATWHETGRWLGYRVELVPDTSLQTYIGNDDSQTATMIPMNDPLAGAAQTLRDRMVRVSGAMRLKDGAPIDLLASSGKAGREISLLVKFTRIEKAV